MKNLTLIFFLTSFIPFSNFASVEIQYAGNSLKFNANPRLSSVLGRVMVSTDFYWHGSSLYRLNSSESKAARQMLLKELDSVLSKTGSKTSKYAALLKIKEQVSNWQVADKLSVELDYDLIRIREELDPRLDDGEYLLHLPFRAYDINVVGAVETTGKFPHIAATSVKAYFDNKNIKRLDYADYEFAYVIHPDGSYKKVSLSAYNQEHVEVAPGGTIYVPIKELPFDSTNEELNERVAKLAGNLLP